MNTNLFLALGLLFLALEHFGVPVPGWLTGIFLIVVAIVMLI